jgi:hypothetical protein
MIKLTSEESLKVRLDSIKQNVTIILMETALKLASLTESNIFFLIEGSEGRRFAGKKHLCDAYLFGNLTPVGNDIQMEADPNVTSLWENEVYYFDPDTDNDSFTPSHHKRKRKNQTKCPDSTNKKIKTDLNSSPQMKIRNESPSKNKEIKAEVVESSIDSTDCDIITLEDDLSDTKSEESFSEETKKSPCEPGLADWILNVFIPNNRNVNVVRSVTDGDLFMQDTIEKKLLSSVFCEFGKSLSLKYLTHSHNFEAV